jgi:hypothetical protein
MTDYAAKLAKIEARKKALSLMEVKLKQGESRQKRKAENQAKIILGSVFLKNTNKEDMDKYSAFLTLEDKKKVMWYLTSTRPKDFPSAPLPSGKK